MGFDLGIVIVAAGIAITIPAARRIGGAAPVAWCFAVAAGAVAAERLVPRMGFLATAVGAVIPAAACYIYVWKRKSREKDSNHRR